MANGRTFLRFAWISLSIVSVLCIDAASAQFTSFVESHLTDHQLNETQRWIRFENGVRVLILSPSVQDEKLPRKLVLFATPNGNSIEQSMGCRKSETLDWRFDIQHVAAQFRMFAKNDKSVEYSLAVVQAPQLSWPEFRRATRNANSWIQSHVEFLRLQTKSDEIQFACHSGGGSFLWGWINSYEELPDWVTSIVFLDANYSYSDEDRHGEKILQWLRKQSHRLIVLAYDDREILVNGKKVIDDDGGTYRATQRMRDRFDRDVSFRMRDWNGFRIDSAIDDRLQLIVHSNPDNKILHTSLVGDYNGLLYSLQCGSGQSNEHLLLGPRAYEAKISEKPFSDPIRVPARVEKDIPWETMKLPTRNKDAMTGTQFIEHIQPMDRVARQSEIVAAILNGNVPQMARMLAPVRVSCLSSLGHVDSATYYVSADYIAIGSDEDWVRMPMTPASGMEIGNRIFCNMITSKISNDLFDASTLRLSPQPMAQGREEPSTFLEHHRMIEKQRVEAVDLQPTSSHRIIVGIKKDVILSNMLLEEPNRVAIFGWHHPDGRVIQPLYVGHTDWYVDYSHGLRLVLDRVLINGNPMSFREALKNQRWSKLLSNEGPIDIDRLIAKSARSN